MVSGEGIGTVKFCAGHGGAGLHPGPWPGQLAAVGWLLWGGQRRLDRLCLLGSTLSSAAALSGGLLPGTVRRGLRLQQGLSRFALALLRGSLVGRVPLAALLLGGSRASASSSLTMRPRESRLGASSTTIGKG